MNEISGIWQMAFFIPFLVLAVILIAALWKIFQKAGYQGWEAIVPLYNVYILLKIVGKPWWWLLLMCIPYVGIVWSVWAYNMLSKSFGKTEGFTAGLIFLPFIFFPMLGFGAARYLGPYGNPTAFAAYGDKGKFDFEQQQSVAG